MGSYINAAGDYYEGDRIDPSDASVPQRPDETHRWNGGEWVVDNNAKVLKDIADLEANAPSPFNIMKRSERQSAILAAVAYAVAVEGVTEQQLYATNAYYRAGKGLEDAAVVLRKQLQ